MRKQHVPVGVCLTPARRSPARGAPTSRGRSQSPRSRASARRAPRTRRRPPRATLFRDGHGRKRTTRREREHGEVRDEADHPLLGGDGDRLGVAHGLAHLVDLAPVRGRERARALPGDRRVLEQVDAAADQVRPSARRLRQVGPVLVDRLVARRPADDQRRSRPLATASAAASAKPRVPNRNQTRRPSPTASAAKLVCE